MKDQAMASERFEDRKVRESADTEHVREKFATLVRAHSGWVYAMARRQLGDPGLAEDASQMVFLALWRKHRRFDGTSRKIGGWLVRATDYACKDIRKMEARRRTRERRVAAMEIERGARHPGAAVQTDHLLKLDAALQRVSAADRTILVSRFFQEQKVCDVAEQMGISEAAAEKRISRAVDRLRLIMVRGDSKPGRTETAPVAALLIAGSGRAPALLTEKLLQAAGCGHPPAEHIDRAARRILRHTSHLSVVSGTTAMAIVVMAAVPAFQHFEHTSAGVRAGAGTVASGRKAPWLGKKTGVLTCVSYSLLTRRDFARAVETSGKAISGKPNGIRAYGISADLVRKLAWSRVNRRATIPFPPLCWLHPPFYTTVHYNGFTPPPLGFGGNIDIPRKKPVGQITASFEFHSHVRPYASFARVRIRFDRDSLIQFTAKTQRSIPYAYSASLDIRPGHAVVLLRHVCTFQGKWWYSAVVFDVERYAYPIDRKPPYFGDTSRYIRVGPAGLAKSAVISNAWNSYALAHPVAAAIPARWKKTFSNGATVAIAAINTHQWPLCSWTPDGQPLPDSQVKDAQIPYISTTTLTRNGRPGGRILLHEEGPPKGVAALFEFRLSQHAPWLGLQWLQETTPAHGFRVGLGYGRWRVLGTAVLSRDFPRYFLYRGRRLVWYTVVPQATGTAAGSDRSINLSTAYYWNSKELPTRAFAVGAITRHGRLVVPTFPQNEPINRFVTPPAVAGQEYVSETLPVAISNVDRYVWVTRPLHWVTFPGSFQFEPSPRPDEVLRIEQHIRDSGRLGRATRSTKVARREAANQATPGGLMELLRKYQDIGNRRGLRRLFYTPTAFDRRAADWDTGLRLQDSDYGLWTSALKRFGRNQMRAAGMFGIRPMGGAARNPTDWNIQGRHAVPFYPLPPGTAWPAMGQPMSQLIRRGGQWYVDCNLDGLQAMKVRRWMRQMAAYSSSERILSNAYRTVLEALDKGKIGNAYVLRDQVLAAIKKFRAAAK